MLHLKTTEEVELLRASNQLVSRTLAEMAKIIEPGISTFELDRVAEEFIRDNNAVPGFKGYNNFPATLCTSVNDEVVHGIPSKYVLKDGDIVSIDCGVIIDGYYGDSAFSFAVGEVSEDKLRLLEYTRASLEKGVEKAVSGNRVGDISYAVQTEAENGGYSVVRELVGHGLGRRLHEQPEVPNYGKRGRGSKMMDGLVICIEPMINLGTRHIRQMNDGWTIRTADGQPSAHFEYAVAVRKGEADVLTTYEFIEEALKNK
ncbi:MAG: type I methionyl aminopeptidase [Bacteroidales bacterium]|nr:type I methionyl aminopeptidase [Bacteroidales bacterium]